MAAPWPIGPEMFEPGVDWTLLAPWPIGPGTLEPGDPKLEPGLDGLLEPGWDGPLFEPLWDPAGAAVF